MAALEELAISEDKPLEEITDDSGDEDFAKRGKYPKNMEQHLGEYAKRHIEVQGSIDRWRIYRFKTFKPQVMILAAIVATIFLAISRYSFKWPVELSLAIAFVIGSVIYVSKL